MSRAFRHQVLVSALSRFVAPPASPGFASVQRADFRQNFTTAVLRRAPTGFSVSFAPEPDEPKSEVPASSKAAAKTAKAKRKLTKKANPAKKAKRHQEYISEGGINKGADNTPVVTVVEEFVSNPQAQETHVQVGGGNELATGGSPLATPKGKTVEVELENSDPIPRRLSTDALTPKDYLKAQYGASEGNEKRSIEKQTNTQPPIETTLVYDDNLINHQAPLSTPADINFDSIPEGTGIEKKARTTSEDAKQKKFKKQHQPGGPDSRSSLSRAGEDSLKRDSIPKIPKAQPNSKSEIQPKPFPPRKKEPWQVQKKALEQKFESEGWNPRKKLSPDTIDGIRALHAQYPDEYPTPVLAEKFKISPEAIRRILKSKWRADPEKQVERRERWARRHDRIWDQQAAIGLRPARTKVREPKDPGDLEGEAEIGALELAHARTRARDVHLTGED